MYTYVYIFKRNSFTKFPMCFHPSASPMLSGSVLTSSSPFRGRKMLMLTTAWVTVTGFHAKPCLSLSHPDAANDVCCVLVLDTSGHGVNTSDMYAIPNTLEYGNRTYKVISANMTWYTALETCLMHGAELVSIADLYHQSFLTVILNRLGRAHWIGLFSADVGALKSRGQSLPA